jgi:hypothetical protein
MLAFSNGLALSFRAAQYVFKSFLCPKRGVLRPFSQFATVCRSDAQGRGNGRDSSALLLRPRPSLLEHFVCFRGARKKFYSR